MSVRKKRKCPVWRIQVLREGALRWSYFGGNKAVVAPKNCKAPGLLLRKRDHKLCFLKPNYTAVWGVAEIFEIRREAIVEAMHMLATGEIVGVKLERDPVFSKVRKHSPCLPKGLNETELTELRFITETMTIEGQTLKPGDRILLKGVTQRSREGKLPAGYYYDIVGHLVCLPYSKVKLHIMASKLMIKAHWFHKTHYDIPKRRWEEITNKCTRLSSRAIVDIIRGRIT